LDLANRQRLETLRADEAKYRGMFENCVEGIFQTTPAGQYLNVNPALARIYGYDSPRQLMTELNDIGAQLYVRENRRNEFKELIESQGVVTDFESEIRRKDGSVIWISENSRAMFDEQGKVRGYEGTVMDITRRKLAETDLESTQRQLLATRDVSVFALAKLAESRDPETGEHLERMRTYSQLLAEHLSREGPYVDQIDENFLQDLFRSSPLHDIGKVAIPDAILLKPGRFTPEEFKVMQTHAAIGAETLESALRHSGDGGFLRMAAGIARWHHERFDGRGYPDGLAGLNIPLAARIVALADVYDALTSARVYKEGYDPRHARDMIIAASGTQFDPAVVDAFRVCYPDFLRWQGIEPGLLAELLLEALESESSPAPPQQADCAGDGAHRKAHSAGEVAHQKALAGSAN
jgi:PAS domain S-box-containing protein